jgi:hypothetical protein
MDTGEELKLAPIDETFVEREHRLMAETQRLTQDILKEKDIPDGPAPLTGALYQMGDKELAQNVITYLRQMVSEELDEAESTAALIARNWPIFLRRYLQDR